MTDSLAEGREEVPRVSILCTAFNEERHLGAMLRSVCEQTMPAWEMLIIDDDSTDRTVEIMRSFAAADTRIRILSTGRKLGKVGAFNLAFAASRGNWIVLMGADDIMPPRSLEGRLRALSGISHTTRAAGFFKLKTLSEDPRLDGKILPRSSSGSRSGPSITLSRPLAQELFPVPEVLPSEDPWLGEAANARATSVVHDCHVVVHYRIHQGNSSPRNKPFSQMNEAIAARGQTYALVLAHERDWNLSDESVLRLRRLVRAENMRYHGRTLRLLVASGLPLADRLALAAQSDPRLYLLRNRFYSLLAGRRGR